jgi:hypothetical protein
MLERKLFGFFRQRSRALAAGHCDGHSAPAAAPDCGISIIRRIRQKERPSRRAILDPTTSTRAATNAADAQAYVPGTTYEPTKSGTPPQASIPRACVLSEEELLTDRDRSMSLDGPQADASERV